MHKTAWKDPKGIHCMKIVSLKKVTYCVILLIYFYLNNKITEMGSSTSHPGKLS